MFVSSRPKWISLLLCALCLAFAAQAPAALTEDLRAAAESGDLAAGERALKGGAPVQGAAAIAAMDAAIKAGNVPFVDLLLNYKFPLEQVNDFGNTALVNACFYGQETVVAKLLSRGANAGYTFAEPNGQHHSPLIAAALAGSVPITKLLLDHKADPNALDGDAIVIANFEGDVEMYQLLKKAGGRDVEHPVLRRARARELLAERKEQSLKDAMANAGVVSLLENATATNPAPRKENAPCRVAILADGPNAAAADALAAKLAGVAQLQVLDRKTVDRLLAEKGATSAQDPAAEQKSAAALQADAVLHVQQRNAPAGQVVETRIIRAQPGLLLAQSFDPAPLNVDAWVEEWAGRLPELARQAVAGSGIALSLLDLRPLVDSPGSRSMAEAADMLLSKRIQATPGWYVLDRNDFSALSGALHAKTVSRLQFWNASYVVDGVLEAPLASGDPIRLKLRFQPAEGAALQAEAAGASTDLGKVLDQALGQIRAKLTGQSPVPSAPPQVEAKQYVREAHFDEGTERYAAAAKKMEIAWALGDRSSEAECFRIDCENQALHQAFRDGLALITDLFPQANKYVSRDLLNHPFRTPEMPTAAELFRSVNGVMALVDEAWPIHVQAGQDAEAAAWLVAARETLESMGLAICLHDTAAMRIEHAADLTHLKKSLHDLYARTLQLAPPGPASTKARADLLIRFASYLILWSDNYSDRRAKIKELMALHFPGDEEARGRARIRETLTRWQSAQLRYSGKSSNIRQDVYLLFQQQGELPPRVKPNSLWDEFKQAAPVDDRIFAWNNEMICYQNSRPEQQVAFQTLLPLLWEAGPAYADNVLTIFNNVDPVSAAPSSPVSRISPRGDSALAPELQTFRRQYFCMLVRGAKEPLRFTYLVQGQQAPNLSGEAGAEVMAALHDRYGDDMTKSPDLAMMMKGLGINVPLASPVPSAAPDPVVVNGPLPTLTAEILWEPGSLGLHPDQRFTSGSESFFWGEDRLWVVGHYSPPFIDPPRPLKAYIFSIALPSLQMDVIPLPDPPLLSVSTPYRLIVTPERIVVAKDHVSVMIYDRQAKSWETLQDIIPVGLPQISGDDLYFRTSPRAARPQDRGTMDLMPPSAIIRYNPKSKATAVIVSHRRDPQASPLDNPERTLDSISWNSAHELEVWSTLNRTEFTRYAFNPATQAWREVPAPEPAAVSTLRWRAATVRPEFLGGIPASTFEQTAIFAPKFLKATGPGNTFPIECTFDPTWASQYASFNGQVIIAGPRLALATPRGWILPEGDMMGAGKCIWFIPWTKLNNYIQVNPAAGALIEAFEKRSGMKLRAP